MTAPLSAGGHTPDAQSGHFGAAGLPQLAAAVAAVLDLCDQADASLRSAVPMSAAESIIERGSHTVKVGKVRRAISKALADVEGSAAVLDSLCDACHPIGTRCFWPDDCERGAR